MPHHQQPMPFMGMPPPPRFMGYPIVAPKAPLLDQYPTVQIIKDRLYFSSGSKPPLSNSKAFFYSIDDELTYDPFNNDFGPLTLA